MIVLLTFSLFGVLYLVGRGRRAAVKDRIAEQSSLMSVLGDEAQLIVSAKPPTKARVVVDGDNFA